VGVRHPTLWIFIKRLKDEEVRIQAQVRQLRAGVPPTARRNKWCRLEDKIVNLKAQYSNGTISLKRYWNAIRFLTHASR